MRPVVYTLERLQEAFLVARIMTMQSIQKALGGSTRMTAFRKLAALDYRSSYSHGGQFYTLNQIAEYDEHGLWSFEQVHFSMQGSLLDTAERLVGLSREGYFAHELQSLVQVRVHNALAKLHREGRLIREQLGGEFLYVALLNGHAQLRRREQSLTAVAEPAPELASAFGHGTREQLQALLNALNEKQRRLYLGFESLKLGHGGDRRIAHIAGVNVKTVARGRTDLQAGRVAMDRIRCVGAGRPAVKKNRSDQPAERPDER